MKDENAVCLLERGIVTRDNMNFKFDLEYPRMAFQNGKIINVCKGSNRSGDYFSDYDDKETN